jgi:large subunit ribosomal protein L23
MRDIAKILKKPLITEKGTLLREKDNKVVFAVPVDVNKVEIKRAVEEMFSVHVEDVKTMIMKGKTKRWGQHPYARSDWKKAIITLKAGESIEFYEGV